MGSFSQKLVVSWRNYLLKWFKPAGSFLASQGISANLVTTLAFLLGLGAVYFLFKDPFWFVILGILHLIADGLDGWVARSSKVTTFGRYYDLISDRMISLLCLIKVALYLEDYYVYIIIGLLIITKSIYFYSKLEYPVVFVRSGMVIALMFAPLNYEIMLTLTYLVVGAFLLYSLALQFQYWMGSRVSRK